MITAFIIGAIAMYMFLYIKRRFVVSVTKSDMKVSIDTPCKMVLCIRSDLGMTKGKAIAQACHAVLEAYKQASPSVSLTQ